MQLPSMEPPSVVMTRLMSVMLTSGLRCWLVIIVPHQVADRLSGSGKLGSPGRPDHGGPGMAGSGGRLRLTGYRCRWRFRYWFSVAGVRSAIVVVNAFRAGFTVVAGCLAGAFGVRVAWWGSACGPGLPGQILIRAVSTTLFERPIRAGQSRPARPVLGYQLPSAASCPSAGLPSGSWPGNACASAGISRAQA